MDKLEVFKTLDTFCPDGQLIEIRAINASNPKNNVWSGYFKSHEMIWNAIQQFDNDFNIYFVLNVINDVCYSMVQKDKMVRGAETTKDHDIIARRYVLIDLDCVRGGKKISSTKEELNQARMKAHEVRNYLRDQGFSFPVVACSGSGYHLIYKIDDWANTDDNAQLLAKFLQALSLLFSDDNVKIDTVVWNAARVDKLYGTIARKGANTLERPHRLSKIVLIPDEFKPTDKEYFIKVASFLPEEDKTPKMTYANLRDYENFNIDSFLSKHNIEISKDTMDGKIRKIVLKECPFNADHKAPDSALFVMDNGAIGFKCLHQSCSHYSFKDFRLKYDPTAYDKKDYREFQFKQRYYGTFQPQPFEPAEETEEKGKKWLTSKDIKRKRESEIIAIPTGYSHLDKAIRGLILGEVTILSGLNGSGKSSWLNSVMLNVIQRGFKVACFSGELTDYNVMKWLSQSAAGKNYVYKVEGSEYAYDVDDKAYYKICDWLEDKFYLFNNNYGNRFEQVLTDLDEIVKKGVQLVVIDNLMALSISGLSGDKNEKQKQFILDIVEFAKKKNVHCVVVCHPRKESGSQTLLRKESIAGSSDLSNAVQNVAIVHRCGEDFCKRASEFFGKEKAEKYMEYSNVVEWCKCRSYGVVDYLTGLFYEVETKRFKNYVAEHVIYGWQDEPNKVDNLNYHTDFEQPYYSIIKNNEDFLTQGNEAPF